MGPVQPAVSPVQARFSAVLMALLSLLALVAAGVRASAGDASTAALFLGLAAIGTWQVLYYRRLAP